MIKKKKKEKERKTDRELPPPPFPANYFARLNKVPCNCWLASISLLGAPSLEPCARL